MSTRATIACANSDGGYQAAYLHFDGYPEHAGVVLNQWYNSIEKASALIAGGELRSLNASDGAPEYFPRARLPKHLCDRASLVTFARNCDANYLYVFEDGHWHCQKI
ncbi:hypothetical protein VN12_24085 [Pirellula sp. SH-Sr6A]|uniref:hypothetical protein n=1 Tax=Pirellula sp. SH-Sr6A TaxID=1632865 RepID=UPI00078CABCB|nr:hypothetical protein [Pirellula sp. SH-Sr6A]AMV35226.1 hypothetical protein VN12_24085 [Pirellula sp. SH-Sr6A]